MNSEVYVVLRHRRYGMYNFCKEYDLPRNREAYFVLSMDEDGNCFYNTINEDKLLEDLPKDFLPAEPSAVLLLIETSDGVSVIRSPSKFRKYEKYFDAYALVICKR